MSKVAVILYHKDLDKIYLPGWIDKSIASIKNQTFQDFKVYELCYSEDKSQLWEGSIYTHKPLENHIMAMNEILDIAFGDNCEVVFNVNLDDYFAPSRFELQLKAIEDGFDLVSSNFQHVEDFDGNDVFGQLMEFHDRDIIYELNISHNVVAHPCVAMTREFWETNKYYNVEQLGYEDMALWQKAINNGSKITILPQILLFYRQSANQTGRINSVKNGNN